MSNFWIKNYIEYKSIGDRNKTLSVEECLNKIRSYLKDIISNLKKSDKQKTQSTIGNNFLSFIDNSEECVIHLKTDNVEIIINDEADKIKVIIKFFHARKNRYENDLESMKGSDFVFDYVYLLYYKCHKINLKGIGSYINSPDWIRHKKATIIPINKKITNVFSTL